MTHKKFSNAFSFLFSVWISLLLLSCSGTREARLSPAEIARIDSAVVAQNWHIPDYPEQFLRPRTWNLLHTRLWVRFSFSEQLVIGQTELLLTSLRNTNAELILDTKTTKIDSIFVLPSGSKLDFRQDSSSVTISLPKFFGRGDSLELGISFKSYPPGRGLYFVNPTGADPDKPTQIWTLGQPEDNSFWFPTIDHPAERTTQELWISVPDRFQTLSNGFLISQTILPGDSLRTDYWRLSQPHAPYLLALAVGTFDIAEEVNNNVLFRYYTEPAFSAYTDIIYKHTPEMLRFIEEKTGVSYPWDAVYSQAPVRDFIASGMENTTATLLFDGVQFDQRAAQDLSNQDLIMHELAHQWYGNLVTAQDWANLPINEGFASYFEYLYRKHQNGEDAALWKALEDRNTYFREARHLRRPVISARYQQPEDVYDRHTYQKSALILRMLHNLVGDEVWWSANNSWLTEFAFQSVSIRDLQSIFERETGESLQWFFKQWFHEPGHPELFIEPTLGKTTRIRIQQMQNQELQPTFRMKTDISFVFEDSIAHKSIWIEKPDSVYVFSFESIPQDVILDPYRIQLAEYRNYGTLEQNIMRLSHPSLAVRLGALQYLDGAGRSEEIKNMLLYHANHDPFYIVRLQATEMLSDYVTDTGVQDFAFSRTFENEKEGRIRLASLYLLSDENPELKQQHLYSMMRDTSYFVASEAILLYAENFPDTAFDQLYNFFDGYSWQDVIRIAVVQAYSELIRDERSFDFLRDLAVTPGDRRYIQEAISALPNFQALPGARNAAIDAYLHRLGFEHYPNNRVRIYEALVSLQAQKVIPTLELLLEDANIAPAEKDVLYNTIKALRGDLE